MTATTTDASTDTSTTTPTLATAHAGSTSNELINDNVHHINTIHRHQQKQQQENRCDTKTTAATTGMLQIPTTASIQHRLTSYQYGQLIHLNTILQQQQKQQHNNELRPSMKETKEQTQ